MTSSRARAVRASCASAEKSAAAAAAWSAVSSAAKSSILDRSSALSFPGADAVLLW